MNHLANDHLQKKSESLDHHHHHDTQEIVEQIIQELKARHIRITQARRAIITYLVESHSHPTAEEIYYDLLPEHPGLSLATVYNNLGTLIELGYVHEMKFSGVTSRFDFMGHQHFHIICEKCHRVADFPSTDISSIKKMAHEHTGYEVRSIKLEMYGICPECQSTLDNHNL